MRAGGRRGIVTVLVLLLLASEGAGIAQAQPVAAAPLDGRVQELVDEHILMGDPGGDLQLDRRIRGGEFITLVERVLHMPASSVQHLTAGTTGTGSDAWIRIYAWSRTVWGHALTAWGRVQQVWFDLRYRREADQPPWGLARTHWMSAALRDAYLKNDLIDLSFKPMEMLDGSEAIDLVLAAAGYSGEVTAIHEQMPEATPDEARNMVCRQHGLDRLMQYAGRPLTRRDAAVMVWVLMADRTGMH